MGDSLAAAAADLRSRAGRPSLAALAQRSGLAKGTLIDLLEGRRRAQWRTVEAFVRACRAYPHDPADQGLFDERRWLALFEAQDGDEPPGADRHLIGPVPVLADAFEPRTVDGHAGGLSGAPGLCQLLSGLGGVGKTQLAAELARRLWDAGEIDLLIWVAGSSRDGIVAGYAEAFAQLHGAAEPGDKTDDARAAARLLAWLATTGRRWLVVVDDLVLPADLHDLWPPATASGRTVVTTRRADSALAGNGRTVLPVGGFSAGEAYAYLERKLAGRPDLHPGIAGLPAALGHLPLALAQAAAYLVDRGLTGAEYRRRLDRTSLDRLVPEPDALPDGQTGKIAGTWALSVELADSLEPRGLARPLLDLLSLLDPHGIPAALLAAGPVLAHLGAGPDDAADALHCLRRLTLVSVTAEPHAEVVVHALVQRVNRERLSEARRARTALAAADGLVALWPPVPPPGLERYLRVNGLALLRVGALPVAHELVFRVGRSLGESGDTRGAAGYFRERAARAGGRDALRLRHEHMYWVGRGGDDEQARDLADRLLADLPETADELALTTRMYAARWAAQAGDVQRAVRELPGIVEDCTALFGPGHPDTLTARNDLAHFRGHAGDPAAAVAAFRRLTADRIEMLGPDHPHTLLSRNDLAYWTWRNGDAKGAAEAFAALVGDCTAVLGPEHWYTLGARGNLARCRGEAGDPAAAVAGLTAVLADFTRVLGPDHPMTARSRDYLAEWSRRAPAAG